MKQGAKILMVLFGAVFVLLGIVGLFLPLLPTVPFLILAAFLFARSSDRLHDWLMSHPRLGPPIHNWHEHGAISRRAKWISSLSILIAACLGVVFSLPPLLLTIQIGCLIIVAIFIWTRPD